MENFGGDGGAARGNAANESSSFLHDAVRRQRVAAAMNSMGNLIVVTFEAGILSGVQSSGWEDGRLALDLLFMVDEP